MARWLRNVLILVATALILLLVGGRLAADWMVEWLWFRSLALEDVFWTRWTAALGVRLAAIVLIGAFVFANLWVAAGSLERVRIRRRFANIEIAERIPTSWVVAGAAVLALLSAAWLSLGTGEPIDVIAAMRAVPWGSSDPVFGRDLSFYVFTLPLLARAQMLAGVLLFWTALLCVVVYVSTASLRWTERGPDVLPLARKHLAVLVALGVLIVAWDLWLDRYQLMVSGTGVGGALGYTDVHARIPARAVSAAVAVLAAGAVAYGGWVGTLRPPAVALSTFIAVVVIGHALVPAAVQRLRVEPDELRRERPYIEMNLAATRDAYGVSGVDRVDYELSPGHELEAAALLEALERLPLWDPRPLRQTYSAQQSLFRYYDFETLHYDRYGPPEDAHQVVIGVRELDLGGLPDAARTWQNEHLTFVHGEGVVVTPAAQMAPGGEPQYWVRDLAPPRLAAEAPRQLRIRDPEIFFGERSRGYVLVDPNNPPEQRRGQVDPQAAVDAPAPDRRTQPLPAGVPIDSFGRRLLFAWAFQSRNLLLSGEVTPTSRIVYRRQVMERVRETAPFLRFPTAHRGSPYPVVHEGRVVWILDGYTTAAHLPLSAPSRFADRTVRYVRNSVKATVDAVTGEVTLYAVEPDDPVLRTYQRVFPGFIRPLGEMPEGLRRHMRVPPDLFDLQSMVLREYHLRDARAFYNKDDVWEIPTEKYREASIRYQPLYAMMRLPGEARTEFVTAMPFVVAGRQNMTAVLVARNDPPHYGERILLELPRDELIAGPQQVEAMIDQDPVISEQLSLWTRAGSGVIRGHMAVVPVQGAFFYVEPVFLEARESAIPQLERVILASGRTVVMEPTLERAIEVLTARMRGERPPIDRTDPDRPDTDPDPDVPPDVAPIEPAPIREARRLVERADAQLRAGDWAGFGETWERLRRLLDE